MDLSAGEFEVVKPHRLVRIGGRSYPAVFTGHDENLHHATIPMENGGLVSVARTPSENVWHINAPHFQVTPPEQRSRVRNPDLFVGVGTVHGDEDLHKSLQSLAKTKIDSDAVANNRRLMTAHQQLFHDRRD